MAIVKVFIKIPVKSLKKKMTYVLKLDIDKPIDFMNEVKSLSFNLTLKDNTNLEINCVMTEVKAGHIYAEATEETIERIDKLFIEMTNKDKNLNFQQQFKPTFELIHGGKS